MATGWRAEGPRKLPGTGLLFAATIVHLVTIPIALMLTKLYLESLVGRTVTWDDFFRAWNLAGLGWLLWLGVILQLTFALFAAVAGNKQRLGGSDLALAAVVVGVLAIVLSFVVFGGLFGALGGGLSVGGGLAGRARPPSPWAAPPPPYAPPYPPR